MDGTSGWDDEPTPQEFETGDYLGVADDRSTEQRELAGRDEAR